MELLLYPFTSDRKVACSEWGTEQVRAVWPVQAAVQAAPPGLGPPNPVEAMVIEVGVMGKDVV